MTALIWIGKAISHLPEDGVFESVFFHQLNVNICTNLKQYEEAIRSLKINVVTLRFVVEDLHWQNGEASLGEGRTIYAEGVRCSLSEVGRSAIILLNLVNPSVVPRVQSIVNALVKLTKQL